jgi:hypothetical protein
VLIKNLFLNILIVLISIYGVLFISDILLDTFGKKFAPQSLPIDHECNSKDKMIEDHGEAIYKDGGWRNSSYTEKKSNFSEIWYDTLCMGKIYRNKNGIKKLSGIGNETYKLNKLGYRGREWSYGLDEESINRVFIVGGSSAYSFLNTEEFSIHNILEKELNNNQKGEKFYVFNAAVPAAFAIDEYNILHQEIINYNPSIVVFFTGFNDSGQQKSTFHFNKNQLSGVYSYIFTVLNFLGFDNLYGLLNASGFIEMNNVEAFKKATLSSKEYCKKNNIRCIFVLQPTPLVKRFIFSDAEKRIEYLWSHHTKGRGNRIKVDYEIFDNFFKSKEHSFEYLDLTNTGAMGLFSGHLAQSEKYLFEENKNREMLKFDSDLSDGKVFSLQLNGDQLVKALCSNASLIFKDQSKFQSECTVKDYENLSRYASINLPEKGHNGILMNTSNKPVIFKINTNKLIESLEVGVNIKNSGDRDPIVVEANLSYDGLKFDKNQSVIEPQNDNGYGFIWKLDKSRISDSVYVSFKFRQSFYIGLSSFYSKINGDANFKITDSFIIKNVGDSSVLATQKHKNSVHEIFIDGAHLTKDANKIVGNKISQQILR